MILYFVSNDYSEIPPEKGFLTYSLYDDVFISSKKGED